MLLCGIPGRDSLFDLETLIRNSEWSNERDLDAQARLLTHFGYLHAVDGSGYDGASGVSGFCLILDKFCSGSRRPSPGVPSMCVKL